MLQKEQTSSINYVVMILWIILNRLFVFMMVQNAG